MDEPLIVLSRDKKKGPKTAGFKSWRRSWKKKSRTERIILWIMFGLFVVYGLSLLYPLIWALFNAFKPVRTYNNDSLTFVFDWTFDNFVEAFKTSEDTSTSLVESIWNSIWMSVLSTGLGIFGSSLTAYVVAKYRFKASKFIYALAIFLQIIPLVGGIAGMYQLLWKDLPIADNPFLIWVIWFGGFGFSFLMLHTAFKSVPWSYAESAFIDGAGHFSVFLRIMLPAVRPVIGSLFIVNFIGAWNNYMTAYLYMPSYAPLALAVYKLRSDTVMVSMPAYLAVIVISIIPTLILFITFQKLIMENTTTGGLKG